MSVKSGLLLMLEQHKGETISGEFLAGELGCTRAAVWKAVKTLREEGYQIEAGPNRGYILTKENNRLSEEGIRLFLHHPDVNIQLFQELSSTNQTAKEAIIRRTAGHGSIVVAESQSRGRGRMGREFFSPSGSGLYLSVILKPAATLQDSLLLTTAAATAVYQAVKKVCGTELDIKWVNDLYLDGKKTGGILTEAITDFESGMIEYAVVGIGLNLTEPLGGFPDELFETAGAICRGKDGENPPDRNRLAAEIVNALLEETRRGSLSDIYLERNIIPGHRIQVIDGEKSRPASALEICPDGRLKIREKDGRITFLNYGEVSIRTEEELI